MTHEHTPGPWRVGTPSVANGVQIFYDTDLPLQSTAICTMPSKGRGRAANARLIAAAPELFDACKDALGFGDEQGLSRVVRPGVTLEQALRTAIAAVNGGVS